MYFVFVFFYVEIIIGNETTDMTAVDYYWPIPVIVITIMTKNNPCGIFFSFYHLSIYVVCRNDNNLGNETADTCDRDYYYDKKNDFL